MLFDSHSHLNFKDFEFDRPDIIADCQKNNIGMINVGSQLATSRKAVEIADQYKGGIYAAVGHHPIHVSGSQFHPEEFKLANYKNLIKSSKKIVAIGETGIDFFHDSKIFSRQKELFISHVNLAKEFDLPLIIHSRSSQDGKLDVYEQIVEIVKEQKAAKGVIHCFLGTVKQAQIFLELGFYLGFTGIITFPKTDHLAEVIKSLPLEKILIETDCPYLAPVPHRGQRNQPQYVRFVAEKIAEIRQIEYNEVEAQTYQNGANLFNI